MEVKDFIEKAIEGGWPVPWGYEKWLSGSGGMVLAFADGVMNDPADIYDYDKVFLDPLAWQAVGKVEGWKKAYMFQFKNQHSSEDTYWGGIPEWHYQMHRMIGALADGKTVEQYLKTL